MAELESPISANVWKIQVSVGDTVETDTVVTILEAMKTEIPIEAETAGTVTEIRIAEGDAIDEGDVLMVIE